MHELYTRLPELKDRAMQAARAAGRVIMDCRSGDLAVRLKESGYSRASRILTRADAESQEILLARLLSGDDYPEIGLLSEETPDDLSRLHHECFWAVDPLDGTLAFAEAGSGFAISIALVSRTGQPLLGVVHDPVARQSWWAVAGQGAWLRKDDTGHTVPLQLQSRKGRQDAAGSLNIYLDQGFREPPGWARIEFGLDRIAVELGYAGGVFHRGGGAVLNGVQALFDGGCYFKSPKSQQGGGCIWDYAATVCLASEAGGWCSDAAGQPLQLNNPASVFLNHCGVVYAGDAQLGRAVVALLGSQVADQDIRK
ncbi:3'(2'),5'-bisphosphate nucleotidase CysQ family protein [Spirochaeta africana]|uniref:Inositol monophosphatase/fructose-1,6-bisphosphatase family protein n=1 Tax=Spirochaeta africana (strain ATCC 700263 / DSM 8902 / Z-7692) TaxID=889378 RepID=H9UHR3_SPIAZ|nr:inositol monophosphatase family protein [Spirochaeta africana]AFG37056.1 inositol monophosphatase/fructose-1,6-bisphosphatase family protein [Spirochaeta africana DSM 8902]